MTYSAPLSPAHSYDAFYYQHCCGMPYARTDAWLSFFGGIAERIARDIQPASVLDAGCAMGFLVESLRARGIDAFGLDVSEFAVQQMRSDIKPYCWVGSVLDPLPRRYDLIVCMEVLEHLSPQECDRAVINFGRACDDVLFCSTPDDYHEATHVNVQPPEYWAGLFARHGFFRDIDFDATFITPWAMRFRRGRDPVYRLIEAYERRLSALSKESAGLRELASATRAQLAQRDQMLAAAQAGNRPAETELQAERLTRQELAARLADIQASAGWRFVLRVGQWRQRIFPPGSRREKLWFAIIAKLAHWLKL